MGLHSKEKLKLVSPAYSHTYRPLLLYQILKEMSQTHCINNTLMKTENAFVRFDLIMNLSKVTDFWMVL